MGEVYLVEHGELDIKRAVKRLKGAPNPEKVRQIKNAGKLLAKLKDPRIVEVIDLFQFQNQFFLVMEYIEGEPLNKWLNSHPDIRERLEILKETALAVHHAHKNNIIHRDIKPGNIMVTPDKKVKILDFDISQNLLDVQFYFKNKKQKSISGTPCYMAPELFEGAPPSISSDVYALGMLLYLILFDNVPVKGSSLVSIKKAHLNIDLSSIEKEVPRELASLLRKSLVSKKDDRLNSALSYAKEIEDFLESDRAIPLRERISSALYAFWIPGIKDIIYQQKFTGYVAFLISVIIIFLPGRITLSILYRSFWALQGFSPNKTISQHIGEIREFFNDSSTLRKIFMTSSAIFLIAAALYGDYNLLMRGDSEMNDIESSASNTPSPTYIPAPTPTQSPTTSFTSTPFSSHSRYASKKENPDAASPPSPTPKKREPEATPTHSTLQIIPSLSPSASPTPSFSPTTTKPSPTVKVAVKPTPTPTRTEKKISFQTSTPAASSPIPAKRFPELFAGALEDGVNADWGKIKSLWDKEKKQISEESFERKLIYEYFLNCALYWYDDFLWRKTVRDNILNDYKKVSFKKQFTNVSFSKQDTELYLTFMLSFSPQIIKREVQHNSPELIPCLDIDAVLNYLAEIIVNQPEKIQHASIIYKNLLKKNPSLRKDFPELSEKIETGIQK